MTNRQLEWFVANTVMGVKVRPTSGIGADTYGDWGYTWDRNTIAQAEHKIGGMGDDVKRAYVQALEQIALAEPPKQPSEPLEYWDEFELLMATPKQRCQAMHQIREHIAQARKAAADDQR